MNTTRTIIVEPVDVNVKKDRDVLQLIPIAVFWGTTYLLLNPELRTRIHKWLQATTRTFLFHMAVWEVQQNIRELPETDHINN